MGRLGVLASDAMPFFRHAAQPDPSGNRRHLHPLFDGGRRPRSTRWSRCDIFKQVLTPLRAAGFTFKYIHAANSAGTLISKETHFNAVRVGLAMYGLSPSELARCRATFKPVLSWKTVIAQVKTLPPGHPVGYGSTYYAKENERVAVIPVGYADGLRRSPQYWGHVLVQGQIAPIIGRVSMEKTTINVTAHPRRCRLATRWC